MSDNFDRLPDAGMGENTQTHTTGGDSTRGGRANLRVFV